MSNLIFNRETSLPTYELIRSRDGGISGIKVRRPSYSVYYHRTGRGAKDILDSPQGELHALFGSSRSFASFLQSRIVLDLGCGDGRLVNEMSDRSAPMLGLDLHLSEEQKKNPFFFQSDAFRMNFYQGSFDSVIALWSVFHYEPMAQIASLMREVHRVLRNDGTLIIPSLHNVDRLQEIKIACRRLGMETTLIQPSNIVICRKF